RLSVFIELGHPFWRRRDNLKQRGIYSLTGFHLLFVCRHTVSYSAQRNTAALLWWLILYELPMTLTRLRESSAQSQTLAFAYMRGRSPSGSRSSITLSDALITTATCAHFPLL